MITLQRSSITPQTYRWTAELSQSSRKTPYGTWYKAEGEIINQPFIAEVSKEDPFKTGGKDVRKGVGPVAVTLKSSKSIKGDFFKPITIVFLRSRVEDPDFSLTSFENELSKQLSESGLNSKFDELPWHKQVKVYEQLKDIIMPKVETELNKRFPNHTLSDTDRCRALFVAQSAQ